MGRKRDLENQQKIKKSGKRTGKHQQDPMSFKKLQKNLGKY